MKYLLIIILEVIGWSQAFSKEVMSKEKIFINHWLKKWSNLNSITAAKAPPEDGPILPLPFSEDFEIH